VGKYCYGYLIDVIITRDVWMHRIDIARAAGKELELTDYNDGRVHMWLPIEAAGTAAPSCSFSTVPWVVPTSRAAPVRPRSIASTPSSSVASCRDEARAQDRSSFRRFEHCVRGGTEQARFGVRTRNIRGTRSKQNVLPNVHSIEQTLIDQGFYEVGGDGIEPPTPAL
jgi:hypothetical protein